MTKNVEIKTEAIKAGVMLWEVADALGVHDSAFSRMLRKELPEEKKTEIIKIITNLQKEGAGR